MVAGSHYLKLPSENLPEDDQERLVLLLQLFPEHIATARKVKNGWYVQLRRPADFAYHVDPTLKQALKWWDPSINPTHMADAIRQTGITWLSLYDSWGIVALSNWYSTRHEKPLEVVYLHADDHGDLNPPLLGLTTNSWVDLLTGKSVYFNKPESVEAAVRSGAIGIGSFLPLLFHSGMRIDFRHLRHLNPIHPNWADRPRSGIIEASLLYEEILAAQHPAVNLLPKSTDNYRTSHSFKTTDDPAVWVDAIPMGTPVIMHIDLDVFCNRYDRDSDWQNSPRRHDPPITEVLQCVDDFTDALAHSGVAERIEALHIAFSPGFFPGEMWAPVYQRLVDRLQKFSIDIPKIDRKSPYSRYHRQATPKPKPVKPTDVKIDPNEVSLKVGRGSSGRGGGAGGHYWHIFVGEQRVGYVFINVVQDKVRGRHASITIQLNRTHQGRGIGRVAYRLACEASNHNEIYAHMRKSNIASMKAAMYAGFCETQDNTDGQLTMVWHRSK